MKRYVPKNLGWYEAVAVLFGPFVVILVFDTEWLGRLVAISLLFIVVPVSFLWVAFTKKKDYLGRSSWIYKRYGKEHADQVLRVIVMMLTVVFFITMTPPFLKDIALVVEGEAPLRRTSIVTSADVASLTGLISEELTLDEYTGTPDNSFSALYFPPRHIMQGNTYEFLYLPNTHEILEARLISEKE